MELNINKNNYFKNIICTTNNNCQNINNIPTNKLGIINSFNQNNNKKDNVLSNNINKNFYVKITSLKKNISDSQFIYNNNKINHSKNLKENLTNKSTIYSKDKKLIIQIHCLKNKNQFFPKNNKYKKILISQRFEIFIPRKKMFFDKKSNNNLSKRFKKIKKVNKLSAIKEEKLPEKVTKIKIKNKDDKSIYNYNKNLIKNFMRGERFNN